MKTWTRCSPPAGLTLIETVAGLALLGGVVVTLLYAQVRFTRNAEALATRRQAVEIAEELLASWWIHPETFPIDQKGIAPGRPAFQWRTTARPEAALEPLRSLPVRVQVLRGGVAVLTLDVVVPRSTGEEP